MPFQLYGNAEGQILVAVLEVVGIFTITESATESVHPEPLVTMYLTVAVPAVLPVTKPALSTEAIVELVLVHEPPDVVLFN